MSLAADRPLTHTGGCSFATLRERPAAPAASTTAPTSLQAPGTSSAAPSHPRTGTFLHALLHSRLQCLWPSRPPAAPAARAAPSCPEGSIGTIGRGAQPSIPPDLLIGTAGSCGGMPNRVRTSSHGIPARRSAARTSDRSFVDGGDRWPRFWRRPGSNRAASRNRCRSPHSPSASAAPRLAREVHPLVATLESLLMEHGIAVFAGPASRQLGVAVCGTLQVSPGVAAGARTGATIGAATGVVRAAGAVDRCRSRSRARSRPAAHGRFSSDSRSPTLWSPIRSAWILQRRRIRTSAVWRLYWRPLSKGITTTNHLPACAHLRNTRYT